MWTYCIRRACATLVGAVALVTGTVGHVDVTMIAVWPNVIMNVAAGITVLLVEILEWKKLLPLGITLLQLSARVGTTYHRFGLMHVAVRPCSVVRPQTIAASALALGYKPALLCIYDGDLKSAISQQCF